MATAINFSQKLIDRMAARREATFHSPEFLKCVVKHGLLSASADVMDAYELQGFLIRDEALRPKRFELGMIAAIESLTPAELQSLRGARVWRLEISGAKQMKDGPTIHESRQPLHKQLAA